MTVLRVRSFIPQLHDQAALEVRPVQGRLHTQQKTCQYLLTQDKDPWINNTGNLKPWPNRVASQWKLRNAISLHPHTCDGWPNRLTRAHKYIRCKLQKSHIQSSIAHAHFNENAQTNLHQLVLFGQMVMNLQGSMLIFL